MAKYREYYIECNEEGYYKLVKKDKVDHIFKCCITGDQDNDSLLASVVIALISAVVSFSLSFTSLSPFIIGGIIGFIPYTLFLMLLNVLIGFTIKYNCLDKDVFMSTAIPYKKTIAFFSISIILNVALGAGLGALASRFISTNIFSSWCGVAIGIGIGVVAANMVDFASGYVLGLTAEEKQCTEMELDSVEHLVNKADLPNF
ncbi:hypothetical protein [Wolbachia endosymbiont of Pentidionis agamae]|uniref:hypothetical protein n=1 Tax=Wolbachia endosymbiont of Pentidionis agamae TaxID=3110435 RepID=UPI002FCF75FD